MRLRSYALALALSWGSLAQAGGVNSLPALDAVPLAGTYTLHWMVAGGQIVAPKRSGVRPILPTLRAARAGHIDQFIAHFENPACPTAEVTIRDCGAEATCSSAPIVDQAAARGDTWTPLDLPIAAGDVLAAQVTGCAAAVGWFEIVVDYGK